MKNVCTDPRRTGFTLFEVAISLGMVSFAVVTTLIVYPVGLKAQQMARFRLLACTKAEEMVEAFNDTHNANPAIDTEAENPWELPVSHRSQVWDLEQRLSAHRFGIMPVPPTIVRRLDSDDDEIGRISSDGGNIYYSQPQASTNLEEDGLYSLELYDANKNPRPMSLVANETQRLVFAVSGYAQNNSMHIFPQKNWPYVVAWPSPPTHTLHYDQAQDPGKIPAICTKFGWGDTDWNNDSYDWEATSDPDIDKIFAWNEGGVAYGFLPYAYGNFAQRLPLSPAPGRGSLFPGAGAPSRGGAVRYVQAALWYCQKKGLPATFFAPALPATSGDFIAGTADADQWKQVQAMRFLAHAASCLTRWFSYDDPAQPQDLKRGVKIPHIAFAGIDGPAGDQTITHDLILYYHERSLVLAMKYAACLPYDWGAPRPLNRSIMMDYPLMEFDLFSPPLSGTIFSTTIAAAQWKPIAAQPIVNGGASMMFPGRALPANTDRTFWGNPDHFTLTAPFTAAQRCRQIVFWAVDWMSYEDAETAPGAPVDASKYPINAPIPGHDWARRMSDMDFRDEQLYSYRNPEKVLIFKQDVSALATGADVSTLILRNDPWTQCPDQGAAAAQARVFSARWGADRNFNLKLDRGPIPRSTRMRAIEVARFNYYDPRVPAVIH